MKQQNIQPTIRQAQDDTYENEIKSELDLTPHEQELKAVEDEENALTLQYYNSLKKINPKNHPSFEELKAWRNTFGRIYTSTVLEPERFFVWRTIMRLEWKQFTNLYGAAEATERQVALLEKCLLFPPVDIVKEKVPAGYLESLESQIMHQSGFLPPEYLFSTIEVIK